MCRHCGGLFWSLQPLSPSWKPADPVHCSHGNLCSHLPVIAWHTLSGLTGFFPWSVHVLSAGALNLLPVSFTSSGLIPKLGPLLLTCSPLCDGYLFSGFWWSSTHSLYCNLGNPLARVPCCGADSISAVGIGGQAFNVNKTIQTITVSWPWQLVQRWVQAYPRQWGGRRTEMGCWGRVGGGVLQLLRMDAVKPPHGESAASRAKGRVGKMLESFGIVPDSWSTHTWS